MKIVNLQIQGPQLTQAQKKKKKKTTQNMS